MEAGESRFEQVRTELRDARGEHATVKARLDALDVQDLAHTESIEANRTALLDYQGANDARVELIENLNSAQENRLDALEIKNTEQDGDIAALEVKNMQQDSRMAAIEAEDVEQNERLDAINVKDGEQDNRLAALEAGMQSTGESQADKDAAQDARMDRSLNENGTLKAGKQIHDHFKFVYQAVGGETSVSLPEDKFFQEGDMTLDVFVNGLLQAEGLHYSEIVNAEGKGTGIDFAPEVLVAGDIIIMKYQINNAE